MQREEGRARWQVRAGVLALALVALGLMASLRGPRGADAWEALLGAEGVGQVERLEWLTPPQEGRWAMGVVEARPESDESTGQAPSHRDLFLFEGMLGGDGRPWQVRAVGNLTQTPDADDALLAWEVGAQRAMLACASAFDGEITSVSLVDLAGDPTIWRDDEGQRRPLGDSFKLGFTYWQELSRPEGVLRRSHMLTEPARDLKARFDGDHLVFSGMVAGGGEPRKAWSTIRVLDGAALDVHASALGLREQRAPWVIDTWIQFAVNRARSHPWVGASRIALLERFVFDHVDSVKRAWYALVGFDNEALAQELGESGEQAPEEVLPTPLQLEESREAVMLEGDGSQWPPKPVELPAKAWGAEAVPGEGRWTPWVAEWMDRKRLGDKPWPVYRTAFRVSEQKQYEHMVVVAMDMRQLDLNIQAGIVSPRSTTGYRGTGVIPRDPDVLRKVLLAFNGGFKTTHGAYGVVLGRRKFVPQKPAMATLAIYEDKAIRMGTWPGEGNFGNYGLEKKLQQVVREQEVAEIPSDVVDLRQNLPPLAAQGKINPSGAVRWGGVVDHLSGTSTPRSGICVSGAHTLMYVWGGSCSAAELGMAMLAAGCDYGMHLDMNPYHTGMVMYEIPVVGDQVPPEEGKDSRLKGTLHERASRKMMFDQLRYAGRDLKDFFYVTRRQNLPDRLGQPTGFGRWSARGLPVAGGGLEPLAGLNRGPEHDEVLLGLNIEHLTASSVEVPEGLPPQGEVGEVQIGLWLGRTVSPPEGVQAGRLGIAGDGRLAVEGIPSQDGGVKELLTGVPLFINGALAAKLPDETLQRPVVVARTLSGDALLAMCDGCALRSLMDTLDQLDVDSALLLGEGGWEVIASDTQRQWKVVHTAPYRQTPTLQLRLIPTQPRPRTGLTDFKAPLASSQQAASAPNP